MIRSLFKTIRQRAEEAAKTAQLNMFASSNNESLTNPDVIEKHLQELSLKEATIMDDADICHVPNVPEECPKCDNFEEIRQWIQNSTFTRTIEGYNIHCSGTRINATISGMLRYWKSLGWINPGYNIGIHADGSITVIAELNQVTNGVKGFNLRRINIMTIGGLNSKGKIEDTMTPEQYESLKFVIIELDKKLGRKDKKGHRDFPGVNKACPCYDFRTKFPLL